jgi:hydroxymethylpyrimidine/phosphomethylpyrimidine kinase
MSENPTILCIGGHDPTGGAGIQADIETATALGCRAYSIVTCLTNQDTHNVHHMYPQATLQFAAQLDTLLADTTPDVVKIGLLGSPGLANELAYRLRTLAKPVVLDPILAAGGGTDLANQELLEAIQQDLLPLTTLLTPNHAEARRLSSQLSLAEAVDYLFDKGCQAILMTGADESRDGQVLNTLHEAKSQHKNFTWDKLPHQYHGSGCTLASACACGIAQGKPLLEAVEPAQAFTYQSLQNADHPGSGQYLPKRFG